MIAGDWPDIVRVDGVCWSNMLPLGLSYAASGAWTPTILDRLCRGKMLGSVGCSCSLPSRYLPRVAIRVVTGSSAPRCRCLREKIDVSLPLRDTMCIGRIGSWTSCYHGSVRRVVNRVLFRPLYRSRTRGLSRSLVCLAKDFSSSVV